MYDRGQLVELIERSQDHDPFCPACHASTEVVDDDGAIVLRCAGAAHANGIIERIGAALLPHIRTVLVEREELLAA